MQRDKVATNVPARISLLSKQNQMMEESPPIPQQEKKKRPNRTSLSKVIGGVKKKSKTGTEDAGIVSASGEETSAAGERYSWVGNPVCHYNSVMIRTDDSCEQISVGNFINVKKVGKTGKDISFIAFVNDMTERLDAKGKILKRVQIKKVSLVSAIPAPSEPMHSLYPQDLVITDQEFWVNIDRVLERVFVSCLTPGDDNNDDDEADDPLVCRYFYEMESNVFIPMTPQNVEFMMRHGPLNEAKEIFERYQSRGGTLPAYRDKRNKNLDEAATLEKKVEMRDANKVRREEGGVEKEQLTRMRSILEL